MRNIYCSPIPSVCDLFAPHFLKLSSLQLLSFLPLFLIVSFSLLFFLFLPFLFHLLSNNHPSPSSLTSLSPTASASCISHPCLILLFWHLCWFVLLMCYHFCATLAFLLGPSAPVAEENIAWAPDADPISCRVPGSPVEPNDQPRALVKQSWAKGLRTLCLPVHTGKLRDHGSSRECLTQRAIEQRAAPAVG